jgi:hypothetical protein
MSIRLFNPSGGFIDLNAGGDGTAANVFTLPAETGTLITTAGVPKAALPAGSVLQVVSATKTDVASYNSQTFADISGMSVSITPSSATSKILVFYNGSFSQDATSERTFIRLLRNSTDILLGDASGSNRVRISNGMRLSTATSDVRVMSNIFLDSPNTTSATTYKLQWARGSVSNTIYINQQASSGDDANGFTTASTITVMEIAA